MAIINCYDVNGDAIRFLTQWDHDISIRATGVKTSPIPEFRFSNKNSQKSKCISGVVVGDGVKAIIPNGFLQEALPIYVQLFYTYPSGDAKTEHTFVIPVKPASMPDGAVYEPVEVRSVVELEKRVKALEENGVPGAGGVPPDPSFDTVSLGGDAGVVIIPEGTADAPAITFYGAHGDKPVALNNVADATDDRSAPNLGQVKQLVEAHSGNSPLYIASDEPPEDTGALWVNTSEQGEAVALGVTAEETPEGVVLYCTDELGTTTALVRHGKDGAPGRDGTPGEKGDPGEPGQPGATPQKGVDYFTPADITEIARQAAGMVEVPEGGGGAGSGEPWEILVDTKLTEEAEIIIDGLDDVQECVVAIAVPAYPDGDEYSITSSGNLFGVHLNGIPVRRKNLGVVFLAHVWITGDIAHALISSNTTTYTIPDFSDVRGSLNYRGTPRGQYRPSIYLNWGYPPGTDVHIAVRRGRNENI